jgi:hypothetical protein
MLDHLLGRLRAQSVLWLSQSNKSICLARNANVSDCFPDWGGGESLAESGADSRIRTDDLIITNDLLYQLSYIGILSLFRFQEQDLSS